MDSSSVRRVRALFERWLPDDCYEDIVSNVASGRPFAFSRFGDGEFNAIFGERGSNIDGHAYHPALGLRLRRIVESEPSYLMGLQPLAIIVHGLKRIGSLADDISWVLADSLHNASHDGRLAEFFDVLARRRVLLVGPEHLEPLVAGRGWRHLQVPSQDCWREYEAVLEQLKGSVAESGDVVLFCASMMSNVLIDDMVDLAGANTYIDAGSVFDPYVGVVSRRYHQEVDLGQS